MPEKPCARGYPISACVITLNEVDRISECLESLHFCSEIVVVDSGSRDGTQGMARGLGARVVHQDWLGHIAQKEYATRLASHDWVLAIDADERVSAALRDEILERCDTGFANVAGYHMPRMSLYRGKWIRHGNWYPNRQLRLFDRRQGRWGGVNPHDRFVLNGCTGRLQGDLLHIPYRTVQEQLDTIEAYTTIAARELAQRGCRWVPGKLVFNPFFRAFRSLVLKRGFADGWRGIVLAALEARYAYLKYRKLMVLQARSPTAVAQRAVTNGLTPEAVGTMTAAPGGRGGGAGLERGVRSSSHRFPLLLPRSG